MNVQIKHNDSDITEYVISYNREHKICSSIGTLDITIDRSSGLTFDPWDSIKIYENGDFKVEYFVSDAIDEIPTGTMTLRCQDNSKRLVDYFISDTYTIDYPTYTRTWIEKFLAEAGISYQFTTSSQGNLLSNFTSLGLMSGYEQILQLLQLSGWYMYFDGNGKAIIGSFGKSISPADGKIDENDILEIAVIDDDKMLRNRVVVLGSFDPIFNQYASADVSITTKWNYDSRDKRSIVISNSNIPNKSSALAMANQLLKEFSRITVEKHMVLTDARDYSLGNVLNVTSRAYAGKGVITTFGVTMDRNGLVTNIVLDERCPRLFGFFNFGDYVYVSTYGDGVWRKHIEYDHTWYDFSSGLDQLAITDLHVANGLFTSVGASGEMYYNIADDASWSKLNIESLLSVPPSGLIYSGDTPVVEYNYPYSGIMGRATILERDTARMLFAVDNYSGINLGDYYMMLSGMIFSHETIDYNEYLYSGMVWSGGKTPFRGWILEYNPVTNETQSHPIHVSGNYNIRVFDIETDGANDYVSVLAKSGTLDTPIMREWGYADNYFDAVGEFFTPVVVGDGGDSYPDSLFNYEASRTAKGLYFYSENNLVTYSGIVGGIMKSDFLFFPVSDPLNLAVGGKLVLEDTEASFFTLYTISDHISYPTGEKPFVYQASPMVYDIYLMSPEPYVTKYRADFENGTLTYLGEILDDTTDPDYDIQYRRIGDNLYLFKHTIAQTQYLETDGTTLDSARATGTLWTIDMSTGGYTKETVFDIFTPSSPMGGYWIMADSAAEVGVPIPIAGQPIAAYIFENNGELFINGLYTIYYDDDSTRHVRVYKLYGLAEAPILSLVYEDSFTTSGTNTGPYNNNLNHYKIGTDRYAVYYESNHQGDVKNVASITDEIVVSYDTIDINAIDIETRYGEHGIRWDAGTSSFIRYYYLGSEESTISPPDGFIRVEQFYKNPVADSDNVVYANCVKQINETTEKDGFYFLYDIEEDKWYDYIGFYYNFGNVVDNYNRLNNYSVGNWFINANSVGTCSYSYLHSENYLGAGSEYLLLQKPKAEDRYIILDRGTYPIRAEISQYAPILSVTDKYAEFDTIYIYGSGVEFISPLPTAEDVLSGVFVNDYRYALLPDTSGYLSKQGIYLADYPLESNWISTLFSGVVLSGIDETNQIRTFNVDTYSGIENMLNMGYSGILNRIETTNYAASGQYIFVTTSGDNPMFYQKDALESIFIYYSGLPVSRATMIRIDDRI